MISFLMHNRHFVRIPTVFLISEKMCFKCWIKINLDLSLRDRFHIFVLILSYFQRINSFQGEEILINLLKFCIVSEAKFGDDL